MKWKSHVSIARAISAEMCLPEELERGLCNGSVEPDRRPDLAYRENGRRLRIVRAPHHNPPTGTIMAYLWRARRAYLIGNDYWAMKNLGRALHYIQDKSVSPGRRFRRHDAREEYVADLTPPWEAVVEGIEIAECSPRFVRECIRKVRPLRRPEEIMYQATLFSSAIAASVLGPPDADIDLMERYRKAVRAHRLRPALGGAAAAISLTAVYAGTHPAVAVAGMAVAAMIILDPAYRRICTEAEWFGLDDYKL
jgi:hypothetical protein